MSETQTTASPVSAADALWQLYQFDLSAPGGNGSEHTRESIVQAVGEKLMCRDVHAREIKQHPVTQLQDGRCPECGTQYAPSHELAKLSGSGMVRGCYTCERLITFVTVD